MGRYLHICSGRHELLIDAVRVREVLELEGGDSAQKIGEMHLWRGESIQVVHLSELLEETSEGGGQNGGVKSGCAGLVLGSEYESTLPALILCDRVVGLIDVSESAFLQVPPVTTRISFFIDKVLPQKNNKRLLLLFNIESLIDW